MIRALWGSNGLACLRVDSRAEVDETKQIEAPAELDQSDEARRTRVWRLDQFVALGFDLARAAIMADDSRIDLAQARFANTAPSVGFAPSNPSITSQGRTG
jgi:hypothetical protein